MGDTGEWLSTDPARRSRTGWGALEIVVAGAVLAAAGLFLGDAVAGIDFAVLSRGYGPAGAEIGITYGSAWIELTVPLLLLALLAAWWTQHGREASDRGTADVLNGRLRPFLVAVAVLGPLTAAAGVSRLGYAIANPSIGPTGVSAVAMSAGFCVLGLAGGGAQWLAARRLLGYGALPVEG